MALAGLWLVVKDWHDLTPAGRDSTSWRLGLHRRPLRFRPSRHLDDVPAFAAVGVAIVAIVDLVSAVTPNVSWRGDVLVSVEPVAVMRGAHALAVPVSFALLLDGVLPLPAPPPSAQGRARAHGRAHGVQRREGPRSRGGRSDGGRCSAPLGRPLFLLCPARAGHAAVGALARAVAPGRGVPRVAGGRCDRSSGNRVRRRHPARDGRPPPLAAPSVHVHRRRAGANRARDSADRSDRAALRRRTSSSGRSPLPGTSPTPSSGAPLPGSSASTEPTRSRSSSCARTSTTSSIPNGPRSSPTVSRTACS